MNGFKHPALKQLTDQQVRFAPPARRVEQAEQARRLLAEIDPSKRYPYQFVCYRVTGFRPEGRADVLIDGADGPTTCEMIRRCSDDVLTLEEVSTQLHVSTKNNSPLGASSGWRASCCRRSTASASSASGNRRWTPS